MSSSTAGSIPPSTGPEHEQAAVSAPLLSSSPESSTPPSPTLPPRALHLPRSNSKVLEFEHVPSPLSRNVASDSANGDEPERNTATMPRTTPTESASASVSGRAGSRPASRGSSMNLFGPSLAATRSGEPSRGSMILYRLASEADMSPPSMDDLEAPLQPPAPQFRNSTLSTHSSGKSSVRSSIISLSDDESKYPSMYGLAGAGLGLGMSATKAADVAHAASSAPLGQLGGSSEKKAEGAGGLVSHMHTRTLIPYMYDPTDDDDVDGVLDDMDLLHDPGTDKALKEEAKRRVFSRGGLAGGGRFPWRGLLNVGMLVLVIVCLLALFISYPVIHFFATNKQNLLIDGNIRVNSTGQAPVPVFPNTPALLDAATPDSAKTRTGFDGEEYELVFSDEFELEGRTFYPGDDPLWEAVDLWYGATADLEWYDPRQVTTRGGALVITMDSADTTQPNLTPNSTAPFTPEQNHDLTYRSGMLQSWNKFCFTSGYIEVAVVLPGPSEDTQGYWPGSWLMGNLGRPGYEATTDGMWPYSYDSCDVGTLRNQTTKDGSGPAAALHSDQSRPQNNYELSWLTGQRLSACTCPTTSSYTPDHPGPFRSSSQSWLGRGAPEIDILEAEKDKANPTGQVVSQSAQFAPFSHDYTFLNDTDSEFKIWDTSQTRINSYHGSPVQQAVSALSKVPSTGFQGSGKQFIPYGFEYFANPASRSDGFITWQVNGQPTARMSATSVGPDTGSDGSQVGQRLIPEEPMSIVLNLGISHNWQTIDLTTMQFPAELLIDYVRVYQRKGQTNIGCDPKDYPTMDYIANHPEAYSNANATSWMYEKPKNSQFDGC